MSTRSRAASKSSASTIREPRAHRVQRRLVHEVREVRTGHPGRAARDHLDVHVRGDLLVAHVHFEDLHALFLRGERDDDLAVEAAGTQQRRVEDVGTVRRGHHHDALGRLEAVHLGEHLVERLLALVVATTEPGAALATDGVDLVDEDDRRRLLARGLEEIAHPGRADTHEHLHEVGAGDRDERHAGLARDRAGDERLAGAGRPDEEHALRDARPDLLEALRELQEVDDLGDLLLDRPVARDVVERRLGLLGVVDLRPAAADVHDRTHLALGAAAHPDEEPDDEQGGEQQRDQVEEEVRPGALVVEVHALPVEQVEILLRAGRWSGPRT